jgi:hypothetical protein
MSPSEHESKAEATKGMAVAWMAKRHWVLRERRSGIFDNFITYQGHESGDEVEELHDLEPVVLWMSFVVLAVW